MPRRISVTVKPSSHSTSLTRLSESVYRVAVREPARDGKANQAVIDLLARRFGVPRSKIKIVHGHTSRRKVIELP